MNALTGVADIDRLEEKWAVALEKYLRILQFELKNGLRLNAAITYKLLGDTEKGLGNIVQARSYYQKSMTLQHQIGVSTDSIQAAIDGLAEEE